MNPHIGHYIVAAVGMVCVTVCVVMGHGNTIVQIAAAIGGASGAGALVLRSLWQKKEASDASSKTP